MMRVRFPLPAPNADIAQLVERTLGKGEVGVQIRLSAPAFQIPLSLLSSNDFIG